MYRLGVLVSGRGSNLKAILEAIASGELKAQVAVVISNKKDALALQIAEAFGVPISYLEPKGNGDYEKDLVAKLQEYAVDLVVLAGYMKLITPYFLASFPNQVINIHPALLPSFPGLNAQKQALDYGVKYTGCTVHYVDGGMDTGAIIAQRVVPVLEGDTESTLAARILAEEHRLLPATIQLFAENRVKFHDGKVTIID